MDKCKKLSRIVTELLKEKNIREQREWEEERKKNHWLKEGGRWK